MLNSYSSYLVVTIKKGFSIMRYVNLDLPSKTLQQQHGTYTAAMVMRLKGYSLEVALCVLAGRK